METTVYSLGFKVLGVRIVRIAENQMGNKVETGCY